MFKINIIIIFVTWITISLQAQNADIVRGCNPLSVNFTSPVLSQYYWDFGDGKSSTDRNPNHDFVDKGKYTVTLKEGKTGNIVGNLEINVYNDPIVNIKATDQKGCVPVTAKFTPEITLDSALNISGYNWTFGDGKSSNEMMPIHKYDSIRVYDVSLEVKTDIPGCETTKIFPNFIETFGVEANFEIYAISDCVLPFEYDIINNTKLAAGNVYSWDLGNGKIVESFFPGPIKINETGNYPISLTVTDKNNCSSTKRDTINANPPNLKLELKRDSVCIGDLIFIKNESNGNSFLWSFDASASMLSSTLKTPMWFYGTSGLKTVKLTTGTGACKKDTSFNIYVEPSPDARFTFSPLIGCDNPHIISATANNFSYAEYYWQQKGILGKPIEQIIIEDPVRDSLYMHYRDTIILYLTVKTKIGCTAQSMQQAYYQLPDAYFLTSEPKGCAPLQVEFTDKSFTHVPVKSIKWLWGDGTTTEQTGTDPINHTFVNPGEYLVKSVIENEAGCVDTSASLKVLVGSPLKADYTIDKFEICLGDTVNVSYSNIDPRIDAWHITTDNNRFNHCWTDTQASHAFITEPGEFDVIGITEYNGCYNEETLPQKIKVKGAKANVGYMINCADPLNVMIQSKSINANEFEWSIGDSTITNIENMVFKFDSSGDYKVKLSVKNISDNCPDNVDIKNIKVRQIKADFELKDKICDTDSIFLNASKSIDVDAECSKGYLWFFSHQRPLESDDPATLTFYPAGQHFAMLVVEDANGCKDTLQKNTRSYGIYPSIKADDEEVCFPAIINIRDFSLSDTTISSWEWSTNANTKNLNLIEKKYFQIRQYTLQLTDALGCIDTISVLIKGYKPTSNINVALNDTVCLGQPFQFFATDFTEQGSNLKYSWTFNSANTSALMNPTFTYLTTGTFNVRTIVEEIASGCKDTIITPVSVIKPPVAAFSSSVDNLPYICHPKIIDFINRSVTQGPVRYQWRLGSVPSVEDNPSLSFPKGLHNITLVAASIYGCADTITKSYQVIGPEASYIKDKDTLCKNEKVTLTLINPQDVSTYKWQFGDGSIIENTSPVSKGFAPDLGVSIIPIDLILKSANNDCELVIKDSVFFRHVVADFSYSDTSFCEGRIEFTNKSSGAIKYLWDFGQNLVSDSINPVIQFPDEGKKMVRLIALSADEFCKDTLIKDIELDPFEQLVKFPNIFTPNNDGENDLFTYVPKQGLEELFKVKQFKIFNRWGHLIFNNEDPAGWNGTFNGQEAPAEVYAYYLEVELEGCKTYSKKGNITLLR